MYFTNRNNIKAVLLCGLIIILSTIITSCTNVDKKLSNNIETCLNGHTSRWAGACVCDNPAMFFGRYCNESPVKDCQSNSDCPAEHFCLSINNVGKCHKVAARGTLKVDQISFTLSDAILSYDNADSFCSALGNGYHSASRRDFNCNGVGTACLDRNLMIELQEKFGNIGFFWLESVDNTQNAYYADLNDGTVYYTNKANFKTNQVLCIRRENE